MPTLPKILNQEKIQQLLEAACDFAQESNGLLWEDPKKMWLVVMKAEFIFIF